MGPDSFAFLTAMLVNFVDMMGTQFTAPVTVPYGRWMGADLETIALFSTVRGLAALLSIVWMPKLSDLRGRKLVIMLSLFGSAIAYAVQGLSGEFVGASIAVFFVGRGLSGFFGGTMPVVRAYVTELSMPDANLMKQRMMLMTVASQGSGIALSPIAGALATFGLSLPYYVCAGVGVFGLLFALCFFQEAAKLKEDRNAANNVPTKRAEDVEQQTSSSGRDTSATTEDEIEKPREEKPQRKNPWCDKVIIMMFFANLSIFIMMSGLMLLIPEMLEGESFGLIGRNREETSMKIAKAVGLIGIPQGVCTIFTSLVFFMPVTKRLGDIKTIMIAGTLVSLNFAAYGLWPSKLWQLCILHAITGICFGFMMPALSPLMGRYASFHYPSQMAQCLGIPSIGMNLSMSFGPNILAIVHAHFGMKVTWILCATCSAIFVILFALSYRVVEARSPKPDKLTAEQRKVLLQIGGEDADKFIDAACEDLRHLLAQNKEKLWNRPMQFLVRQRLCTAMPQVREWNDATHGQEYLDDLSFLLDAFPEESASFHSKFPQAGWGSQLGAMDLDLGGGSPSVRSEQSFAAVSV